MSLKYKIVVIILAFSLPLSAQYDMEKTEDSQNNVIIRGDREAFKKKLKENTYVGFAFNAGLFGNSLFLYGAPQIGYEFLPKLSAGVLSLMNYQRQGNQSFSRTFTAFGGGLFVRYTPFRFLMFEASYNLYRLKITQTGAPAPLTDNAQSFMAGIGFTRSLGEKAYTNVLVSYDLFNNPNNPENRLEIFQNLPIYFKFGFTVYPFNR